MKAEQVVKILKRMVLPVNSTPYGFLIHTGVYESYRIQRGSGIAGRGDIWSIVSVRGNERIGMPCSTEKELAKELREWAAMIYDKQKPVNPGKWYARFHRTRLSEGHIWVNRQPAAPTPEKERGKP